MAVSLADALQNVSLEVGRIYHCQVGSLRVEVRVEGSRPALLPAPLHTSDVMLDPWIDLPAPCTKSIIQASTGAPLVPDVPLIP